MLEAHKRGHLEQAPALARNRGPPEPLPSRLRHAQASTSRFRCRPP